MIWNDRLPSVTSLAYSWWKNNASDTNGTVFIRTSVQYVTIFLKYIAAVKILTIVIVNTFLKCYLSQFIFTHQHINMFKK